MSAPQIPNLLSSRGGSRSRGRGRGRAGPSQLSAASRKDQTIQATDTDAAVSRLSAVSLGYLDDPFAQYFVNGQGARRLPLINRGTYTRTNALDLLIDSFLSSPSISSPQQKQIVSLGAGTDTRYFRLRARNVTRNVIYHEFDFPAVVAAKSHIAESKRALSGGEFLQRARARNTLPTSSDQDRDGEEDTDMGEAGDRVGQEVDGDPGWELLRSSEDDGGSGFETGYLCHPLDLRHLPSISQTTAFRGLRSDLPTLVISECCLCYLEIDIARDVMKWFSDRIASLGVVLYEPIGVDDAFGQMMVENLAARGIVMPTIQQYRNLNDQVRRLKDLGFGRDGGGANAVTIEDVWDKWIGDGEKERVDGLEGLDEFEEWQMLARHYAIVWGWRGESGWEDWRNPQRTDPQ